MVTNTLTGALCHAGRLKSFSGGRPHAQDVPGLTAPWSSPSGVRDSVVRVCLHVHVGSELAVLIHKTSFLNPCSGTPEVCVSAAAPDSAGVHEREHETSARSTAVGFLCGVNTVPVQLKQVFIRTCSFQQLPFPRHSSQIVV